MKLFSHAPRALMLLVAALFGTPLWATDGVIEINDARAKAGGVTAADTPGYPVTISAPGSYRLTGNLTLTAMQSNVSAIVVISDNVSIDLNGFAISGPNICTWTNATTPVTCDVGGGGYGIAAGGRRNVDVRNGSVRGFGGQGISVESGHIAELRVTENGGNGVTLQTGTIRNIVAEHNAQVGVRVDSGAIVQSVASQNGGYGFVVGGGIGHASALSIIAVGNVSDGIYAVSDSVVADSVCASNGGMGLHGGSNTAYRGNTISGNVAGTVSVNAKQVGPNVCNGSLTCP